ncbi:MAG: dihydrofolate reductase [Methylohalobius sp.]|nr:dihydrofolate reductase [Methylohalobius sp.]
MKPVITLIAAIAANRAIGLGGKLPWYLAEDLRRFRRLTWGKSILMGRRTFESIGRPLPGRHNIVLTQKAAFRVHGCETVRSIEEGVAAARGEELMVIGGASLYAVLLPSADRMYLTLIHAPYPGDVFFPQWPQEEWQEIDRQDRISDHFPHAYSFLLLQRIQPGRR